MIFNLLVKLIASSYANDAMMLSSKEQQALDQIIAQIPHPHLSRVKVRLDGICYVSDQQWVIWLNGRRYHPQDTCDYGEIIGATADTVTLKLTPQGRTVTLHVHQEITLP